MLDKADKRQRWLSRAEMLTIVSDRYTATPCYTTP